MSGFLHLLVRAWSLLLDCFRAGKGVLQSHSPETGGVKSRASGASLADESLSAQPKRMALNFNREPWLVDITPRPNDGPPKSPKGPEPSTNHTHIGGETSFAFASKAVTPAVNFEPPDCSVKERHQTVFRLLHFC